MKRFLPLTIAALLFACGQPATDEHSHGDGEAHEHTGSEAAHDEGAAHDHGTTADTAAAHGQDDGHSHDEGHEHSH